MDKYEFNIKVEQIKKLVNKGDYETAMKIADGIDWRRVRSTSLLASISQVYERNEEYQEAKDILLLAFERAPIGKGLLFKLTDLALREGNVSEAEAYYREFCELCGEDPRQNLLRYLILEAKQAPLEQLIVSLERYCQDELDEKWLYKLAELYQKAGREEDCVRICDKLMLLFGLGKYVDKAMTLKQKYAPLTKYQMDLVENREKYEEKLRTVEEEYSSGRRHTDEDEIEADEDFDEAEPEHDSEMEEARRASADSSLREAQAERDLAREISKIPQEEYHADEEDDLGETRVLTDIRRVGKEAKEDSSEAVKQTAAAAGIRAVRSAQARQEERAEETARREEAIAKAYEEEEETVIEDWDLEPVENDSNHLMIEAEDSESGLSLALDSLKKIHRELGTKNPVAKISAQNLNRRGIFSVADRLSGRDLIIERAAELDEFSVRDLSELMEADKSGMIVVLIDTPSRMERLHNENPGLADKFQYIGCRAQEKAEDPEEQEIKRRQAAAAAEAARRQAEYEAEQERKRLEEEEKRRREAEEQAHRQEEERRLEAARLQAEREAQMERQRLQEEDDHYTEQASRNEYAELEEEDYDSSDFYDKDGRTVRSHDDSERDIRDYREHDDYSEADDFQGSGEIDREYEERGSYQEDEYHGEDAYEDSWDNEEKNSESYADGDDDREMDVEEFAQYACKYASEIDCSISGKSMLALYERAEMMEEDGVPLTKESAEDLIEEAADRAEKPSFGGFFSSKYDKDGLLILKEKHFFD